MSLVLLDCKNCGLYALSLQNFGVFGKVLEMLTHTSLLNRRSKSIRHEFTLYTQTELPQRHSDSKRGDTVAGSLEQATPALKRRVPS